MREIVWLGSVVALLTVAGCGGAGEQAKLVALERRVAELEAAHLKASAQIANLRIEAVLASMSNPEYAWFDPQAQKAYQAVKTPVGNVLVVLEKVEPYLDGYKVSFRIGNPSTANLNGLQATVEWGQAATDSAGATTPPTKSVDVKFTDTIRAGAWSLVTANIAPAKAEDIRRIGISPKFDNISLSRSF